MSKNVTKVVNGRVLLKRLAGTIKTEGGLEIKDDGLSLPVAEVVLVGEKVDVTQPGDFVHYLEPREPGKCKHNGEDHFIIQAGNIIAILD
jgi:co-chaperonin GroES (HSP10)